MPRRRNHDLHQAIEYTFAPGTFIDHRQSRDFVEALEAVRARITPLIEEGEPERAVALLETFIAACYEKSEEIDDSSGSFGQLVTTLFCDWIRARQAAGTEPAETVRMLLSWMENDDYGYCYRLEKQAAEVLDRAGLAALERAVREAPVPAGRGSPIHRRNVEILRGIHEARRDVEAYVALCEGEGGLAPADCETLAQMCLARRRPEDALAWVERGLALEKSGSWPNRSSWRLHGLEREILKKLGRSGDALASAWGDYQRAPSVYSYAEFMELVPQNERAQWHTKAMVALDRADLTSRIGLLVETKEWTRLAELIDAAPRADLVALSHHTTDPVAERLAKAHPLLAAKLYVAMALRILEGKKSRYYDAALGNLGKARKLMHGEGRAGDWDALAAEIRSAHRRKTGFMSDFERLAEGHSLREPSFRERVRKRWKEGSRTGREPS